MGDGAMLKSMGGGEVIADFGISDQFCSASRLLEVHLKANRWF
jgi:hypothetical protein